MAENSNGQGIWNVVSRFYRSRTIFNDFYRKYKGEFPVGAKDFSDFSKEQIGPLKELVDDVLKPTGNKKADLEIILFKDVLGDLVHEVRDLNSAICKVDDYKLHVKAYGEEVKLSKGDAKSVDRFREILNDAQERVPRKYEEVSGLFDRMVDVLEQDILLIYRDNTTLLQSMIYHEDVFEDKGGNRLPAIFEYMFEDGEFEAYYKAGAKWLEVSHVEQAIEYLNKAFDNYDSRNGDNEFLERNRGRVEKLLDNVREVSGKLPVLKAQGEIRGDLEQVQSQMDELDQRLKGYLA